MDKQEEINLVSQWNMRFKEAYVHKADYTKRWQQYWDAYKGEYFKNQNLPDYKSNLVSNYIFSIIETIRPIMVDNDPKFQSMPRVPDALDYSEDVNDALTYEWDREKATKKLYAELIPTLVTGNAVFFLPWNKQDKNVNLIPVNVFNLFPDPLATSVDDAQYIIYASYMNVNRVKMLFPKSASKLSGSSINYSELVNGNSDNSRVDNQVLVLEIYTRDFDTFEEQKDGRVVLKYPKGRVLHLCPELGVLLSDEANKYDDGKFPFRILKDYDIPGKFWGEGEVAQLLSPQKHMNDLTNAIIDNAKTTSNMPWIIDKNAGIAPNAITSRPGLIIRKNPGTEVKREQAFNLPQYIPETVNTIKGDMEQVSGIFDSIKGNSETGVYTAQGVLALQEAGQARIRLKVKLMEDTLGDIACMWYSRIQQFWDKKRVIRTVHADGTFNVRAFESKALDFDYDIKITAGSTMPVNRGAMLDMMVRLAQTPMPDGQNLVDREAVVAYLPQEVKSALLRRTKQNNLQIEQEIAQMQQQVQEVQQNDESVLSTIEQLVAGVEAMNKKIIQLQQAHDKLEQEKQQMEKENKIKNQAYNEGYKDAEKLNQSKSQDGEDDPDMEGIPDDILSGIEDMSDDELQQLLEENPELLQMMQAEQSPMSMNQEIPPSAMTPPTATPEEEQQAMMMAQQNGASI